MFSRCGDGGLFARQCQSGHLTSDNSEQPLEFFAAQAERPHVGSDDILADVSIHLDNHGPNQSLLRHDQMVAFDPHLDASGQSADVAQLLP